MFAISNLKYFFLILALSACKQKAKNLNVTNADLSLVKETMLYKEQPYSGTLFAKIDTLNTYKDMYIPGTDFSQTDTLTTYKVTYLQGKKHGKEQKFFYNGRLAELRYYTNGKKSGIHKTWWDNKQLMSEYHFDTAGNYIGVQQEWYRNGQLAKEFNYTNGKEDGTQKLWDYTGKIKANYVVIHGERFGFIGSKDCKYVADNE